MNPHVQWLGYSWQGAPDENVKQLQAAVYMLLGKTGYVMPTVDGVISPTFCGAISQVGYEKTMGRISESDWKSLISMQSWNEIGPVCMGQSMIQPVKADGSSPGSGTTSTTKTTKTSYRGLIASAVIGVGLLAVAFHMNKKG